jgi:hypothetical protein
MGLLDKIKDALAWGDPEINEFEKIISDTYHEYASSHNYFWSPAVNETKVWSEKIKEWPDNKRVRFLLYLVPKVHEFAKGKRSWSSENVNERLHNVRNAYINTLLRHKLLMQDEEAVNIFEAFIKYRSSDFADLSQWPINLFLNQLEKQHKDRNIDAPLRTMLETMKKAISEIQQSYQEKDRIKMMEKIDAMLFSSENSKAVKPVKFLGDDSLALFANPMIEQMPGDEKLYWYRLLTMAQKASGSKPSSKYLSETKEIIKAIGADNFKKIIHIWLRFLVELKEKEEQHSITYSNNDTYNYTSYDYITSVNADLVKGLLWACSHFHDNSTIQIISSLAERAFRKIPGKGPTAASVGNACLYVLYKSRGLDGVGQLSRLKLRIKQASTQSLIEKYLQASADEQGVTVHEIEDMAVDEAGFENGSRLFEFDEYKAELIVTTVNKVEQRWYKPDGSPQKSTPVIVKEKYAAKLKKLKEAAKQAEQTLVAQRDRIDRLFRSDRKIEWEKFQQYYLQHGLLSCLSKNIIWNFQKQDTTAQAIHVNGHWINSSNKIVDLTNTGTVSLWHPVHSTVSDIKAWRDFLVFHQIQQPLKQAFREVYILTDAELTTRSYSNRMAAHILRQHQFNSLAKARGWRYALMGAFDNGINNDKASLLLPEYKLRAEYWISEVNADNAMNDTGIWNYVSTDQVRFINTETNEVVDLINIPPQVLSEVLRDVDLFVGVASVGNDPAWQDNGGLPAYRDYWQSFSFGELSEVAKNRKEILNNLVPRLKIKDVAAIKEKFLVVKGKLRTYKIHIGSTNILMEPNDQYLCIVPDRSAKNHTENVFLPFEGDNGLSIILSKAFLLADDDKITDKTITSQINRK